MRTLPTANYMKKTILLATLIMVAFYSNSLPAADTSNWQDISLAVVPGKMSMMPGQTRTTFNWSNTKVGDRYEVRISDFQFNAHMGTHIDAPIHLIPNTESVDQISFGKLIGPARIIGCSRDAAVIDLKELNRHNWKGAKRLLFKTRNSYDNLWGTTEFFKDFTALAPDAAQALADAGVVLVGIDYFSIEKFGSAQPEVHRILLSQGIVVVEGLDLREISEGDFDLICLPVRFTGREAAPARAVLRQRKEK
jgi:arylformamidase